MQRILFSGIACALVAACASTVDPERTNVTLDCPAREPITGSNIVRRYRCVGMSEQTREEAQRQAEILRDDAQRNQLLRPSGGMR